jgi:hypothetical protein
VEVERERVEDLRRPRLLRQGQRTAYRHHPQARLVDGQRAVQAEQHRGVAEQHRLLVRLQAVVADQAGDLPEGVQIGELDRGLPVHQVLQVRAQRRAGARRLGEDRLPHRHPDVCEVVRGLCVAALDAGGEDAVRDVTLAADRAADQPGERQEGLGLLAVHDPSSRGRCRHPF